MLHIHYGNSVETLATHLIKSRSGKVDNVLCQDWLIVPHHEISRWLQLMAAGSQGVAANWNVIQPGSAIWRLIHCLNPDIPPHNSLNAHTLTLRIHAALGVLGASGQHPRLSRFLKGADDRRQMTFSRELAALFDQYLMYRPDMILDWEHKRSRSTDLLQCDLWQVIVEEDEWHWARALNWLNSETRESLMMNEVQSRLPSRIDFFFLHTLSPGLMSALECVAQFTELNLYQWTPANHYWALARSARSGAGSATEDAHPLLASMGLQLREITELLAQLDAGSSEHFLDFSKPEDLLSRLRQSMMSQDAQLQSRDVKSALSHDQVNIAIHSCHSKRREIEVCLDQLTGLLDQHPDLMPHQIQVVSHDMAPYVPYIRSVFGDSDSRVLPWRVVSKANANPLAHDFLDLLEELAGDRLRQTVFERLMTSPILDNFDLTQADAAILETWIRDHALFHADPNSIDSDRDAEFQPSAKFSWRSGMQRLLAAALTANDAGSGLTSGMSIIMSGDLPLVYRFSELVSSVYRLHRSASRSRTGREWQTWLNQTVSLMLGNDDVVSSACQPIHDAMQTTCDASRADQTFDCVTLVDQIRVLLGELAPLTEGASGGITFSDAAHTRLMPASVIYALGLNDREFPSPEQRFELDLIARYPRLGDRTRRLQDRELFLEWLLSARTCLMLSFEGRHARDNSLRAPSPLISELLSHLDQHYVLPSESLSSHLVRQHPPQAFSSRYNHEPGLVSYNQAYVLTDGKQQEQANTRFAANEPLFENEPIDRISLDALDRFIRNPAAVYLRDSLGMKLEKSIELQADDPPMGPDPLRRFQLTEQVYDMSASGLGDRDIADQLATSVYMPDGMTGDYLARQMQGQAQAVQQHMSELTGPFISDERFSIRVSDVEVTGVLDGLTHHGRAKLLASKTRARHILSSWLRHLVLSQIREIDVSSILMDSEQQTTRFGHVENPVAVMSQLVDLYREARRSPLLFFPASSVALVKSLRRSASATDIELCQFDTESRTTALEAALKPYFGNAYQPGESSDPWVEQAFRGFEWWRDAAAVDSFIRKSISVWAPIMESINA